MALCHRCCNNCSALTTRCDSHLGSGEQARARSSSNSRSRTLRVSAAARSNSTRASGRRPNVALAKNAGRVLSRETLMDLVKGESFESFDRSIDVHVSRIRALIEDNPKKPRRIITVRAAGYVFAKAQE